MDMDPKITQAQSVGERLHQVRLLLKKSQKEMARDLNMTTGVIRDLESGSLNPRPYIELLFIYYGVNLAWLTTGSGFIFSQKRIIVPNPVYLMVMMNLGDTPDPDHIKEVFQMDHIPLLAGEVCNGLRELHKEVKANAQSHPATLSDWGFRITRAPFVPDTPNPDNPRFKLPQYLPESNMGA